MKTARALEVFRQKAFPFAQHFEYGTKLKLNGMTTVTLTCAPSVTENVIKTRIHNDQVILKVMEFMMNQAELSIEKISNRLEYCLIVFQHYLFKRYNRTIVENITVNFPTVTYITHLYVIPQWLFTIYSIIHLKTNVLFINSKEYLPVFLFDPTRKNTHVIQINNGTKHLVLSCEQQTYNSTMRISQFQGRFMNALFERPTINDQLYAPFILDNITKVEYEDNGILHALFKTESSKWMMTYGAHHVDIETDENNKFMMNADQLTSMIKDTINLYGLFDHKCCIGLNIIEKYLNMKKLEHNTHVLKSDKKRTVNILRFKSSSYSFQDLCNFLVFIHNGELWNHEDLKSNIFNHFNDEHIESYKFGFNARLAYLGRYLRVNIVEINEINNDYKAVEILMNSRFQYTYAVNSHEDMWGILYQKNNLGYIFGQNKNKISKEHDEFQVNLDRANRATNVAIAIQNQEEERKRRTEDVELSSQERRQRQKREVDEIISKKGKLGKRDLNTGKRVAILIKAKKLEKEVAANLEKHHAKKAAKLIQTWQRRAEQERIRSENKRTRLQEEAKAQELRVKEAAERALWIAQQERLRLEREAEQKRLRLEQKRARLQKEAEATRLIVEEADRIKKANITHWVTVRREAREKDQAAEAAAKEAAEQKQRAAREAWNATNEANILKAARRKFDENFPARGLAAKSQSAIKNESKTPIRKTSEEKWKPAKTSELLPVVAQAPVRREYDLAHHDRRKLNPYIEDDLYAINVRFHKLKEERLKEAKILEEERKRLEEEQLAVAKRLEEEQLAEAKRLEEEQKKLRIAEEARVEYRRLKKKELVFKKLRARDVVLKQKQRAVHGDIPKPIPFDIQRRLGMREQIKPVRKQLEEKQAQEKHEKAKKVREAYTQEVAQKLQKINEKRNAILEKRRQDKARQKEENRSKQRKAIKFKKRQFSKSNLLDFHFSIAKTIGDIIFLRIQSQYKDYTISYIINLIRYASSANDWSKPNQLAAQPYEPKSIIREFPHIQITLVSKSGVHADELHTPSHITPKTRVVLYESTSKTLYVVARIRSNRSIDIFHKFDADIPKVDATPSETNGLVTKLRNAWHKIRNAIRKAFRIKSSPAERENIKERDKKKPSENPYGDPQEANRAVLVRRILRTFRNKHRSKQDQANRAALVR